MSGSCDEVSAAVDARLPDRMGSSYEAGDRLQGELVDVFFDVVSLDDWSPRAVMDRAAEVAERSADALRRAASKKEQEGTEEGDAEPEPAG